MKSLGGYWREEYFIYETQNFGLQFLCYLKDIGSIVEYDLDGELCVQKLDPNLADEQVSVECVRCGFDSVAENVSGDWELVKGYEFDEVEENMSVNEFIEEQLSFYMPSIFSQEDFVMCLDCIKELEYRLNKFIDSDLRTSIVANNI